MSATKIRIISNVMPIDRVWPRAPYKHPYAHSHAHRTQLRENGKCRWKEFVIRTNAFSDIYSFFVWPEDISFLLFQLFRVSTETNARKTNETRMRTKRSKRLQMSENAWMAFPSLIASMLWQNVNFWMCDERAASYKFWLLLRSIALINSTLHLQANRKSTHSPILRMLRTPSYAPTNSFWSFFGGSHPYY